MEDLSWGRAEGLSHHPLPLRGSLQLVLQVPTLSQTAGHLSAMFPSTPKAESVGHVGS